MAYVISNCFDAEVTLSMSLGQFVLPSKFIKIPHVLCHVHLNNKEKKINDHISYSVQLTIQKFTHL